MRKGRQFPIGIKAHPTVSRCNIGGITSDETGVHPLVRLTTDGGA